MAHRLPRIEQALQQALAEVIQQRLRDPRLPMMLTITSVRVTPDLAEARVSFSQIPDTEADIEASLEILEGARGYLRSEAARLVKLRIMPQLVFFYDNSGRHSQRVNELLNQWKDESARNAPPPAEADEAPQDDKAASP